MEDMILHSRAFVEPPSPHFPAIECDSLRAFLEALRPGHVRVTHLTRTLPPDGQRLWQGQFAVHITGRAGEEGAPILYATFPIARVVGDETRAFLVFPTHSDLEALPLAVAIDQMRKDYIDQLIHILRPHPRVLAITTGARYWLPEAQVWSVQSTLPELTFHEGRWRCTPNT